MKHKEMKKALFENQNITMSKSYEIGRMVKKFRIKAGLTQEELAKKINTKQSSIARIENGSAGLPSLSFLEKIAQVFEVELVLPKFKDFKMNQIKTNSRHTAISR